MKIIKRNGDREKLDIDKIKQVVAWATTGCTVNPLELESRLTASFKDGVSTREIQQQLITQALMLTSIEQPDWRYVAGRLLMMNLWKETELVRGFSYGSYTKFVHDMVSLNRYDKKITEVYSDEELDTAGKWIDSTFDLDYDYAGANILVQRYLVDGELPQEAFLTIALLLASVELTSKELRLHYAHEFYLALAQRRISLATPILINLRRPDGNLSSCFITAMSDNLDSIFDVVTQVAKISKNGGGVGVNLSRVRAGGSWVKGSKNASNGVVPWIKILNDTAVAVNQLGKRAGAVTTSIDIWHLDTEEFLELQTENGDQRKKAYDIFPQVVVPDEFMRRVESNSAWTLLDPHEVRFKKGIELAEKWGDEFTAIYRELEADESLELKKSVNAKELFKHIMRSQIETGMPYLAFKDTINRANPNKHAGYIPSVNLCVTADTWIHTSEGPKQVKDLVGTQFEALVDGVPYSSTEKGFWHSGTKEVFELETTEGYKIEASADHTFMKPDGTWVAISDMVPGDKLLIHNHTGVESWAGTGGTFEEGWLLGELIGDGSIQNNAKNQPVAHLMFWGKSKFAMRETAVDFLKVAVGRELPKKDNLGYERQDKITVSSRELYDLSLAYKLDRSNKVITPAMEKASSDFARGLLRGLFDADGTINTNERKVGSIRLTSVKLDLLYATQRMLSRLGIKSYVYLNRIKSGIRIMPDGKGGTREYPCQAVHELAISGRQFAELFRDLIGFSEPAKAEKLDKALAAYSDEPYAKNYKVTVKSITSKGVNDVYDCTVPGPHYFDANGLKAHNCVESFSNVKADEEAHTCNLVSLNLANLDENTLPHACRLAVRILDNTIDLTAPPIWQSKAHNDKYRTIGIGSMGLADFLALRKVPYKKAVETVNRVFEDIAYHTFKASADLAIERGAFPAFEGSDFSKGLILSQDMAWFDANSALPSRWRELQKQILETGIRNSHIQAIAPNTSSALVQGCTPSILPIYSKFYFDKNARGAVPICPPFIKDAMWSYQENKNIDQRDVVAVVATIQKWTDTGISMELLFNLNNPEVTAKHIYDVMLQSWKSGCKTVYYVRTIQKDGNISEKDECVSCAG